MKDIEINIFFIKTILLILQQYKKNSVHLCISKWYFKYFFSFVCLIIFDDLSNIVINQIKEFKEKFIN